MDKLSDYGITTVREIVGEAKKPRVSIHADLCGLYQLLENLKSLPWHFQTNKHHADCMGHSSRRSFSGGSISSLLSDSKGNTDMAPFTAAADKVESSDLMDKLTAGISVGTGRKIIYTEDDGEWIFERRHSEKPYQTSRRFRKPMPVMEVDCDFSISAKATTREINRYGAMVYALTSLIERHGIETKVTFFTDTRVMDKDRSIDLHTFVDIKEPGRYLAPSALASAFQAQFYRIAIFILWIVVADTYCKIASGGLGCLVTRGKIVEFADGVLKFNLSVSEAYSNTIETELLKAIG